MTSVLRLQYGLRVVTACTLRPLEAFDRIRGRIENARERRTPKPAHTEFGAEREFHSLIDAPWPCEHLEDFSLEWKRLEATFERCGRGHDADPVLAATLYCAVRHLRPGVAVETGVARGIGSRFILRALSQNGVGHLWSIDLPPLLNGWSDQVASAVPADLRVRWNYLRGSSRRLLPGLVRKIGEVDLFVHDSLHTTPTVLFELDTIYPNLSKGGVVIADDVDKSVAFASFANHAGSCRWMLARHRQKSGAIGVLRKLK